MATEVFQNGQVLSVPDHAVSAMRAMGWKPKEESAPAVEADDEQSTLGADDINGMKLDELKEFAEEYDIDLGDATKKSEITDVILAAL